MKDHETRVAEGIFAELRVHLTEKWVPTPTTRPSNFDEWLAYANFIGRRLRRIPNLFKKGDSVEEDLQAELDAEIESNRQFQTRLRDLEAEQLTARQRKRELRRAKGTIAILKSKIADLESLEPTRLTVNVTMEELLNQVEILKNERNELHRERSKLIGELKLQKKRNTTMEKELTQHRTALGDQNSSLDGQELFEMETVDSSMTKRDRRQIVALKTQITTLLSERDSQKITLRKLKSEIRSRDEQIRSFLKERDSFLESLSQLKNEFSSRDAQISALTTHFKVIFSERDRPDVSTPFNPDQLRHSSASTEETSLPGGWQSVESEFAALRAAYEIARSKLETLHKDLQIQKSQVRT
jgi:hypothetical protein